MSTASPPSDPLGVFFTYGLPLISIATVFITTFVVPYIRKERETTRFRTTKDLRDADVHRRLDDMQNTLKESGREIKQVIEKSDGEIRKVLEKMDGRVSDVDRGLDELRKEYYEHVRQYEGLKSRFKTVEEDYKARREQDARELELLRRERLGKRVGALTTLASGESPAVDDD